MDDMQVSLRQLGDRIRTEGAAPSECGPVIIAVVGSGRVAQGAIEVLNLIGVEWIAPDALQALAENQGAFTNIVFQQTLIYESGADLKKLYAVQLKAADYLRPISGGRFDRTHYRDNPSLYKSCFATDVSVKTLRPQTFLT